MYRNLGRDVDAAEEFGGRVEDSDAVGVGRRKDDEPVAGRRCALELVVAADAEGGRDVHAAEGVVRRVEDADAVGTGRREDDAPVAGRARGALELEAAADDGGRDVDAAEEFGGRVEDAYAVGVARREDDETVAGRRGANELFAIAAEPVASVDGGRDVDAAEEFGGRVEDADAVGVVRREDDAPVAGCRGAVELVFDFICVRASAYGRRACGATEVARFLQAAARVDAGL